MHSFSLKLACISLAILVCGCSEATTTPADSSHIAIADWAARVDTMAGTYTGVVSVVEFHDSLLVVSDLRENLIWRVGISDGSLKSIGSRGGGPGEYRSAGKVGKFHPDSFAILAQPPGLPIMSVTNGAARTHALWESGTVNDPWGGIARIGAPIMEYADTLGHLYGASVARIPDPEIRTGGRPMRTAGMLDTIPIIRFDMATRHIDTIARMPRGVVSIPPGFDVDGTRTSSMELGPFGAFNGWLVTAGGKLIIANAADYALTIYDGMPYKPIAKWQIERMPIAVSKSEWKRYVVKATKGSIAQVDSINRRVFGNIGLAAPALPSTRYIVPEMPRTLPRINFGDGARRMHEYGGILSNEVYAGIPECSLMRVLSSSLGDVQLRHNRP